MISGIIKICTAKEVSEEEEQKLLAALTAVTSAVETYDCTKNMVSFEFEADVDVDFDMTHCTQGVSHHSGGQWYPPDYEWEPEWEYDGMSFAKDVLTTTQRAVKSVQSIEVDVDTVIGYSNGDRMEESASDTFSVTSDSAA